MTIETSFQFSEHLRFYGENGINVIPILAPNGHNDPKRPALDEWTTYQRRLSTPSEHALWWTYADTPRNLGVVTGTISGNLVVVDIDDEETYNEISESDSRFRDTLICKTGKGYHLYFFLDDGDVHRTITFQKNGKTHHLKGENSYVVAPPSVHVSGKTYTFLELQMPAFANYNTLKQDLLAVGCNFTSDENGIKDRPVTWASELVTKTPEGERNTRAAQMCGLLIRKFMHDPKFIFGIMKAWNNEYCFPPLSDKELSTLVDGEYRRYGPHG